MTDVDPWSLYSSLRDETIALIRPLDVDTLNQAVQLTPDWTNYASRTPDRIAEVAGVALMIELGDGNSFGPTVNVSNMSSLTLRATPYDFLRSVTGRRSRSEVAALDWSDDPGNLLDVFSPYGSLRTEDAGI